MSTPPLFNDALRGYSARVVACIMFLYPALALVVDHASTALMTLLALAGIVFAMLYKDKTALTRDEKLLIFAAIFFVLVAFVAWVFNDLNYLGFKKLGRYIRFLLLIPIYLVVRRMSDAEGVWWWGLLAGAMASGALAIGNLYLDVEYGMQYGLATGAVEAFQFGSTALLMSMMGLGGISYLRNTSRWLVVLPLFAMLLGMFAVLASGVRVAWVALPSLWLIACATFWFRGERRMAVGVFLVLPLAVLLGLQSAALPLASRLADLANEFRGLLDSTFAVRGPVGMRMQLWSIAWSAFVENPLLGAGVGGFFTKVHASVEAGLIPEYMLNFTHPHNEYLSALSERGLLGFLSLGLIFGVPLKHFIWGLRHPDQRIAFVSYSGVVLIVGFLHFGLVEAVFDRTFSISFYVFTMAVCYGLVRANERRFLGTARRRDHSLGVFIIAKNEGDRLGATLESIRGWADEIVVLDSGSTDDTAAIARRYTDKVWVTDWPGFGKQKQRALEKTTTEWVLSIDADEVVTEELRNEIDHVLGGTPAATGYRIARPMIIFGRQVDYGGSWQAPIRLFRRELAKFTDVPVHEKVVLSSGKACLMRSPLLHPTYRDYGHALEKFAEYAWLQAGNRWEQGKHSTVIGAALRALYNFFYNYIYRFGMLDGGHGFVLACLHAQYTFNKYAALWANEAQRKSESDKQE